MEYRLADIARLIHGELTGDGNCTVRHVLTDSRSLLYPANTLFFAIPGERNDGHDYIEELYRQGVRSFVVSRPPATLPAVSAFAPANYLLVPNVLHSLQLLAACHRRRFLTPVIGITGSNGKTVVKEWIYQTVHQEKNIVRSPKSYNSQTGVPLSVLLLDEKHDLAIFEAGISYPGEMKRLQAMILPDIGIFTHLGEAHQENFASMKEKASEKLKLFHRCRTVIYCRDHAEVAGILEKDAEFRAVSLFSWAIHAPSDVRIIPSDSNGQYRVEYAGKNFDLTIPFSDHASIENALHVTTLLLFMDYPPEVIAGRIARLTPVAMRLDLKKGVRNCTLVNDTYNSDTGSLSIALDLLARQHQHPVKTVILSDILQSGKSQDDLYREIADLLAGKKIDRLIGVGAEISAHAACFSCEKRFFTTTEELLNHLGNDIRFDKEAILVKGSRKFEFERIIRFLEDQVNKTVMEINLSAVIHNYNYFKSLLRPGVKMAVMVKAFAYGNGSAEIAGLLQHHRADCLAVAFADEGKELRENGITLPIMVMNPEESAIETLIRYRLEPEIYHFRLLEQFIQTLSEHVIYDYPVHIKLDTGMHRLGFLAHELTGLADILRRQPYILVKSVFSHLAGSDDPSLDYFVRQQVDAFRTMSKQLEDETGYSFLRHILNSAGIERFPEAQFDMVRLGIGLHGFSAVDNSKVQPVASLNSVIIQVKDIPAGESVGYNRKFIARTPTRIGIVPVGYADGLHRMLGNGTGCFAVKGKRTPTIGNISMDMCAIDLTDTDAGEGDTVTIFGKDAPLSELACRMQTIPYEVLTRIAPRVKRIYFQE
ncbi:MAG: bifunctional UDP-N-acetylmuramoyl-tripeptide:D-alanyl-D-alanine ligase/alanine racemase [Bacteroidales bacterium]|jgi:alanine racemase|nr:bifunctional UDP-N-acetylmuramoyl-tripeptide:D-alanyl-D-alanine ligase/alanine racemase [Bacteroidales bacterium]